MKSAFLVAALAVASTRTAEAIVGPLETTVEITSTHISGGSIAGIVLGLIAATIIAILLALCWRKKRHEHEVVYNNYAYDYDPRGHGRTVVTEKIEPVVVRSGNAAGVGASGAGAGYNSNYNTTSAPVGNTYNTTGVTNAATAPGSVGYSTAPGTGPGYAAPGTPGYTTNTTTPHTGAVDGTHNVVNPTTTTAAH
ncbi:hypothetical protein BGZ98_002762 [Dissophora globulifera]|nr:hypothetical protein BGZ98_002762 [Dissophora globulifera]